MTFAAQFAPFAFRNLSIRLDCRLTRTTIQCQRKGIQIGNDLLCARDGLFQQINGTDFACFQSLKLFGGGTV